LTSSKDNVIRALNIGTEGFANASLKLGWISDKREVHIGEWRISFAVRCDRGRGGNDAEERGRTVGKLWRREIEAVGDVCGE
jgi:hypothetical protein